LAPAYFLPVRCALTPDPIRSGVAVRQRTSERYYEEVVIIPEGGWVADLGTERS
jgi:hypothetical protein